MHVSRVVFLSLLLLASASYGQAAAPMAPARPPLVRPVTNAPVFPTPGHTPSGAGLPGERVPGSGEVQRSPNKRLLPASKEPGLWAADGAKASLDLRTHIFGIDLPLLPDVADDADIALLSNLCVDTMNSAGALTGHDASVARMTEPTRTCIASLAYLGCAVGLGERLKSPTKPNAITLSKPLLAALKAVVARGKAQVEQYCPENGLGDKLDDMVDDILREWGSVMDAYQNPIQ